MTVFEKQVVAHMATTNEALKNIKERLDRIETNGRSGKNGRESVRLWGIMQALGWAFPVAVASVALVVALLR